MWKSDHQMPARGRAVVIVATVYTADCVSIRNFSDVITNTRYANKNGHEKIDKLLQSF
jgi:hypothetical protein